MQISEINSKVNELGKSWEEFKAVNDRKLLELEKKGSYDPLFDDQLNKINSSLNEQKTRLDNIEIAHSRSLLPYEEEQNSADTEYKNAFSEYLRKGNDKILSNIEAKALSSNSDPEGGYLIRPKLASSMTKLISEMSLMRELASIETISTDSLDIIEDIGKLSSGWALETAAREDTDTPKLAKKKITIHEMYAQPKATQKLIDDASIDIEKWLSEKLADSFAEVENDSFINGDGNFKPRGILSYPNGKNWGEIEQIGSGNFLSDDLIRLYFTLKEKYASKATFLLNRFTLEQLRSLKYKDNGKYIWTPGLAVGQPDLLLGVPVKTSVHMPIIDVGNICVALANFKEAYKIVDRSGIRVLRDPFTDKPFVKFYATKRVGADVVNSEAIKLLVIGGN